jgi:hypothetical protein
MYEDLSPPPPIDWLLWAKIAQTRFNISPLDFNNLTYSFFMRLLKDESKEEIVDPRYTVLSIERRIYGYEV